MSRRLLLINDTSSSANQGCQATMHAINTGLASYFPGFEIDRVKLTTILKAIDEPGWDRLVAERDGDVETAVHAILTTPKEEVASIVTAMRAAELVVINGEGSIGENRYTRRLGRQSAFLFMLIEVAAKLEKPIHLINGTLHLTRSETLEFARPVLAKCATVTVREPYSYFYGRAVCDRVKLFPDLVCMLNPEQPSDGAPYAMVGGSSALNAFGSDAKLPLSIRQQYRRIVDIVRTLGLRVKLMGWDRDDFLREFEGDAAEFVECDFWKYLSCAANARFNFTGRHHGIVMTFRAGCPFSAISANSFKTNGDSRLYGGVGPVEDFDRMDMTRVEQTLLRMHEQHAELRAAALARREALRPFFAGSLENMIRPVTDVVEAGLYRPSENAADYAYHAWHTRTLFGRVARVLSGVLGR